MFWNPEENRLRAGWRVLLIVTASAVVSTALAGPARRVLNLLLPEVWATVVESLVLMSIVALLLWLAARWLDRRRFADYGFHLGPAWWSDLWFGVALGVVLVAGAYAVMLASGWLTVTDTLVSPEGHPFPVAVVADVLIVTGVAGWEELVFRGYLVKNVSEGLSGTVLGSRWAAVVAVVLPAAFFGALHATEENATILGEVDIAALGAVLGVAYVLTGELALPLGLHFGWDFAQGFGFGRSPDPEALGTFLLVGEGDAGARVWTGWPGPVEGGVVGTATVILALVLVVAWVRARRGTVEVQPAVTRPPVRATAR